MNARVVFIPDDGEPIEFSANLTIRVVPDAPEAEQRCVLLAPPPLSQGEDGER